MKLRQILVGLDGSVLAEAILPYVVKLAQGIRAELTLLHVVPLLGDDRLIRVPRPEAEVSAHTPSLDEVPKSVTVNPQAYLTRVRSTLENSRLRVRAAVVCNDPAAGIVAFAQQGNVDLIAMSTHGRSGIQLWWYGSVAEQVLHTSPIPVLLIHPKDGVTVPEARRIIVPLDGSPLAETALPVAEALAALLNVPLVLLEATGSSYGYSDASTGFDYEEGYALDGARDTAEEYLAPIVGRLHAVGISATAVVAMGGAAKQITDHADRNPGSLTVMTTHGQSGMVDAMLGSVARRVVQHGGTPVIIIRPAAAPAPVTSGMV